MSDVPWWSLPLVAVVFALAGAGAARLIGARTGNAHGRWYAERRTAYVELLTVYEKVVHRLRSGTGPDAAAYLDEVTPPLSRVRLLASGPVRSAALAVHLLLAKLHAADEPSGVPGVDPAKHFREVLAQVPLVLQEFEAAIREELDISTTRPLGVSGVARAGSSRGRAEEHR